MSTFLDSLHFLRPQALWLLLLVPPLLLYRWHRCRRQDIWRSSVDPHLLPQLLVTHRRHRSWTGIALGLGGIVAILALAGPSWRQQAQPLLRSQAPLVVVLDLSDRITATDLQPSRLLQARAKLATLLRERQGGEIALVVYAGEAFTVAPLTADAANVGLFLDALAPEVMPVAGQRPDLGVQWAASLLQQAHARQGDIVLLSDRGDGRANRAAAQAAASGYRVSVLGVGTATGAAYRDRAGRIERAALDEFSLRALAAAGQGRYARLSVDDTDLRSLAVLQPQAQESSDDASRLGRSWHDDGYWLLPPLLLLGLLAFRRRAGVSAVLALACLLPLSMPAQAAEGGWWQRADQARHQRLSAGVEAYRSGDYATAQQRFEGIDSDQGWYNLGNALARQGKYDEAIAAYDRALKHQPEMADALANRAAVAAARKRQQQQPGQQGQQSKQNQQNQQNPSGEGADGKQEPGSSGAPSADKGRPTPSPGGEAKAGDSRTKQSANAPPSSAANPPKPAAEDAQSQQQADQAQRERMRQAMQQAGSGKPDGRPTVLPSAEQREQQQAVEAWMQRVPDEPGNLLKTKFQLEYERRMREGR